MKNEKIEKLLERFKTQSLKHEISESLKPLFERLEKPDEFIPESVNDAKHDIVYLELIEEGIELLIKAANSNL